MEANTLADFTITHRIDAQELVAAVNNPAEAPRPRPAVIFGAPTGSA